MTLKNGSTVEDRRLGRLVQFDERSRAYCIADVVPRRLRSHSWHCAAHLDQGREGACVGFGLTHELIARPSPVPCLDTKYAREVVYWSAQKQDPWPGGSYPGAFPKYEGSTVLAGLKVLRNLGWCDEFRWAFNLEEALLGIGYNGPAVLGVPWLEGMRETDRKGFIRATGRTLGGHCILAKAVDVKRDRVTLHNSWGPGWGIGGDAFITFDDLGTLLENDGECAFLVGRHSKPKPPK